MKTDISLIYSNSGNTPFKLLTVFLIWGERKASRNEEENASLLSLLANNFFFSLPILQTGCLMELYSFLLISGFFFSRNVKFNLCYQQLLRVKLSGACAYPSFSFSHGASITPSTLVMLAGRITICGSCENQKGFGSEFVEDA